MKVNALSFATRLLHPRHVVIVTTCDGDGRANAITLAWSMPTSFKPPMVAISVGLQRYSHQLIESVGEFVVNVPSLDLAKQAFIIGSRSGRDVDKFKLMRLTLEKARKVKPPIIKEALAHLECKVVGKLRSGDHTIFVGDVLEAYVEAEVFKDGLFNPKAAKPLLHYGLNFFTTVVDEVIKV